MAIKRNVHPYYDYRTIDSYSESWIRIICGARGLGKTFGAKLKGTKKALRAKLVMLNGEWNASEQFIYVRRTLEEIMAAKRTFFSDMAKFFPNHDFRVVGTAGYAARRITRKSGEEDAAFKKRVKARKWFIICHFKALSVAQQEKGTSFPFVTMIMYDEFIIEKSSQTSYLKSEVEALINFYSTVDRADDRVTLYMLSNSVSIMNPYFMYWKIRPDQLPEISSHSEGDIIAHFPDSELYRQSIFETRFGKFIKRTMPEYADYAVGNEFKDSHDILVKDKTSTAKYKYTVETSEGSFAVWYDMKTGTHFIRAPLPGNQRILTLVPEKMDKGKLLVTVSEPVLKGLKASFNRGSMYFDAPETRNAFVPIFDRK